LRTANVRFGPGPFITDPRNARRETAWNLTAEIGQDELRKAKSYGLAMKADRPTHCIFT
jgi:hypothetical protein